MNFQVSPFPSIDRIALFRHRVDDLWRTHATQMGDDAFLQREVISVMSTDSGHFLLVLNRDELATVRDVCRSENCEFIGIYQREDIPDAIQDQLNRIRQPLPKKTSVLC